MYQRLANLSTSVKTAIFTFIFICLSNYHNIKVFLDSSTIHLTLIPLLFLTDFIDLGILTYLFAKAANKNLGASFAIVMSFIRIGLGMTGGLFLNYFAGTAIGLLGPYFLIASLALTVLYALGNALVHLFVNSQHKDNSLKHKIISELLTTLCFSILLTLTCILFFAPSVPIIYAASIIGTLFMIGASLYHGFAIFDKPTESIQPAILYKGSDSLPHYYRVLEQLDLQDDEQLTTDRYQQLVQDKIDELTAYQQSASFFEQDKLRDKIGCLTKVKTQDVEVTTQALQREFPLAFQSFFRHTSEVEAIVRLKPRIC